MLIDGGGRTLMPGLIDMHWHTMLVRPTPAQLLARDVGYANLVAGAEATDTLMRGFTTVRDLGGPSFGLKRAIDEGVVAGPRIYPVRRGHHRHQRSRRLSPAVRSAAHARRPAHAHGADRRQHGRRQSRMRSALRVREQLMLGATQIKLTAGGGVASPHSPLDASTFTEPELRAAVEAAENWGTYVTVHAYTPASIQRAIAAGVKCIEHGHLMDEATAKLIAERGHLVEHAAVPGRDGRRVSARLHGAGQGAGGDRRHGRTPTGWRRSTSSRPPSAPTSCSPQKLAQRQGELLATLARWYTPAETLAMATGTNAELLALSGKRNPYPGKLGVVEEGALADLLLVDGNPLENIKLIADPAKNFVVIMKDGKIYKNLLR